MGRGTHLRYVIAHRNIIILHFVLTRPRHEVRYRMLYRYQV